MADLKTGVTSLGPDPSAARRPPPTRRIDGYQPRDGKRGPPPGGTLPRKERHEDALLDAGERDELARRFRKVLGRNNPELDVRCEEVRGHAVITVFNVETQAVILHIPAERVLHIDPEQATPEALLFDAKA